MSVRRKRVGEPLEYMGRKIIATFLGPDLLVSIDEVELPTFYIDLESARQGGMRYVDAEIEAQEKKGGATR